MNRTVDELGGNHICLGLGPAACEQGPQVRCLTTALLVRELAKPPMTASLSREMRHERMSGCSSKPTPERKTHVTRGDKTRSVFGPPSRGRTRSDGLSLQGCQVSAHIEGVEQCIRSYIEGVVGMSSFTPGASTQPLNVRQLRQGNDVGEYLR